MKFEQIKSHRHLRKTHHSHHRETKKAMRPKRNADIGTDHPRGTKSMTQADSRCQPCDEMRAKCWDCEARLEGEQGQLVKVNQITELLKYVITKWNAFADSGAVPGRAGNGTQVRCPAGSNRGVYGKNSISYQRTQKAI